jgi:8-oxo-dGTP pyrophosphatase MutT (NUDIX family)
VATPEFILNLRAMVGNHPLWLTGATAVVLRPSPQGDQVLLVQRSDTGEWAPVSGIVDPGEHPATTAVREVAEEAGVAAEVERLVWVTVTDVVTYANGDQTQYLDHVFRCRWLSGEPFSADEESTQAAFFGLDELPDLSTQHHNRILAAIGDDPATRLT